MKHLLHKTLDLKVLLLVTLMCATFTGARAEENVCYTLTPAKGSNNAYAYSCDVIIDDITWNVTGNSTYTPWRIGGKNLKDTDRTIYSKTAIADNVSKIVVNHGNASGLTVNSWTVTISKNDDFSDPVSTLAPSFASNSETTIDRPDGVDWSNCYFKFTYNITISGSSNKFIEFTSATFYINDAGGGDPQKSDCDLAITGDQIELTFDLYDNYSAQVINYSTSSTGSLSIDESDYATFAIDEENKTITVTPKAVTPEEQTITVNQTEDDNYNAGSVTFVLSITDSTPIPTHIATFSVNGETSTEEFEEGADIEFPEDPADIDGKTFMGWVAEAITGVTDDAPEFVTSATMGEGDVTYYAVFADVIGELSQNSLELDANTEGMPTAYGSPNVFNDYTFGDIAFKIQQMYITSGKLQWRADGNSNGTGTMYNSESLGKIESIVLTYHTNDINRNFTIMVGNKAKPTTGTAITPSSNDNVYTFNCSSYNCGYFVLTNGSGAGYLEKLVINYSTGSSTISGYCTTVATDTREEAGISFEEDAVTEELVSGYTGQALTNPNELAVTYNSTNESVATVDENGVLTVLAVGETTITATFAGNEDYKAGNASYVLTIEDSREAIEPAFDAESVRVFLNRTAEAPALNGNEGNGTVTYASSDETIATVDPATGEVTGVADGEATITATIAASQTHQGGEATFTVTVIDQYKKGTANLPYTVEEAIAAIEAGVGVTGVYAKGVVSKIVTAYNSNYGNISYNITDESGNVLQSYRGFSYNGDKFGSADDIQEGDAVVIYGNLTKYNTTYEFAQNNQLVARVASSTESVSATIPTSGYATLSSVAPLNFSATGSNDSDYKAWYITSVEGSTVTLEQITGTIAGCQGVILHGNAGTYDIPTATAADATELEGNLLVATNIATEIGNDEAYGLKNGQFQMINAGTMPAGKAYLPVSAVTNSNEVKYLTLVFNDATGIQRTEVVPATDFMFNLQGVRVQNSTKGGVYIVNGKKVVIK